MSDIAIKVENMSKMYRLGDIGTGSLGNDITRWWASVRGKEDPFTKIATTNDRSQKATSDFVLSLNNLNFDIKKGDAVGVIGRNGAGKSTLLKILSRTTAPTSGQIKINGKVASLLEVGTGFHGDLSGKENIYMNGAILGMSRREITSKLEEIIEFSGVAGYIDTPVKRYSSGMYVRLAFAVAAHLDPDIMIVDEVLAVGDAEFQKKCLGKMKSVNDSEGRTILFVSHSMTAIQTLCNKALILDKGKSDGIVNVSVAVKEYMYGKGNYVSKGVYSGEDASVNADYAGQVKLLKARLLTSDGSETDQYRLYDDIVVEMVWENIRGVKCSPNFQLTTQSGIVALIATDSPADWDGSRKQQKGTYVSIFKIPKNLLNANDYIIAFSLDSHSPRVCFEYHLDALKFTVTDPMDEHCLARGMFTSVREDVVLWPALECSFSKLN